MWPADYRFKKRVSKFKLVNWNLFFVCQTYIYYFCCKGKIDLKIRRQIMKEINCDCIPVSPWKLPAFAVHSYWDSLINVHAWLIVKSRKWGLSINALAWKYRKATINDDNRWWILNNGERKCNVSFLHKTNA